MQRRRDKRMWQWPATLLLLSWAVAVAGCQETVRAAFSYPQAARGLLLEPMPRGKAWTGTGDSTLDGTAQMIVDASVRRPPREKGAARELAVTVTFVDRDGQSVKRSGSFDFAVSEFDDEAPGKAGGTLAAFRAQGEEAQTAWQERRFERRYDFRLALHRDSRDVARKVFRKGGFLVVVALRFRPEEGGELRVVSAPVLVSNPG